MIYPLFRISSSMEEISGKDFLPTYCQINLFHIFTMCLLDNIPSVDMATRFLGEKQTTLTAALK